MPSMAIRARGLTRSYRAHRVPTHHVLRGVDLDVRPGEIFALLGPNGAGKTTLVNILTTLIRPTSGQAEVMGHDVVRSPGRVRQAIGVTGQFTAVDGYLTARENLVMMARLAGRPRRMAAERADELLAQVDLTAAAGRRADKLSGGMRRRLDLAMSLARVPEVLFLDEPTTGMDTRSRQSLWADISDLARQGTTVLLTTQYLEEADQLADRIAILAGGRIISQGTAAELKAAIGQEYVVLDQSEGPSREIPFDGTLAGLRAVSHGVDDQTRISVRQPTMDDVFLSLTGDHVPSATASDQNELEPAR